MKFRMTKDGWEIDGSPKEILEILPVLEKKYGISFADRNHGDASKASAESRTVNTTSETITAKNIFSMLTKRKLSENQEKLLDLIMSGDEKGIAYSEIRKKLGLNSHEFAGLLGGLGRRASFALKSKSALYDYVINYSWDSSIAEFRYRLYDDAREAMGMLKLLS